MKRISHGKRSAVFLLLLGIADCTWPQVVQSIYVWKYSLSASKIVHCHSWERAKILPKDFADTWCLADHTPLQTTQPSREASPVTQLSHYSVNIHYSKVVTKAERNNLFQLCHSRKPGEHQLRSRERFRRTKSTGAVSSKILPINIKSAQDVHSI